MKRLLIILCLCLLASSGHALKLGSNVNAWAALTAVGDASTAGTIFWIDNPTIIDATSAFYGNISATTSDLTIDDIVMDDLTVDIVTLSTGETIEDAANQIVLDGDSGVIIKDDASTLADFTGSSILFHQNVFPNADNTIALGALSTGEWSAIYTTDLFAADDVSVTGDFTANGITVYPPSSAQAITSATNTLLANATLVVLNPDGNYAMTSTPTIANGVTGQIVYLTLANNEANTVNVQDMGTLANSNLQLNGTSITIGAMDVLILLFDGTDWIQAAPVSNN